MLLLGIADIIAGSLLIREFYNLPVPQVIVIIFAGYLIMKGLLFIADIGSLMDLIAGILLILTIFFNFPIFILIVFAALIAIKGVMSLFTGII
ncbi:MAG: hypothetical protein A3A08_00395 [Candidatus Nealsonbacteria bacterium RIFCSPLOWO2_01_FULL_41_9]|uniref:Uncharacterized protein n=1 Tax=Candidatus Nealsonbacteria bacterium RIFCSPLOWO2_01_FULL_41_9 TaxID=1801671 RepID=A0A1G2EB08_9BACT|nr:MAG: hypothetical protein A3A08_00395 [Candidatus Nealsonbacteria bacterium RIFCSPLOWO2_01_FULL_41_9]